MNACDVITRAFYLSGIVSRDLETVSGSQMADGLSMLNDILAEKAATGHEIPYYTHASFSCIIGQEEYLQSGLISIDTATFTDSNIRYNCRFYPRDQYFQFTRDNTLTSRPVMYTYDRASGGSNIYLYPFPDKTYTFNIRGKYAFSELSQCTDFSTVDIDNYYVSYLVYALAERICNLYSVSFDQEKRMVLSKQESTIFEVQPPDMSINSSSGLRAGYGQRYGYVPYRGSNS